MATYEEGARQVIVSCRALGKAYEGRTVVQDVSLEVRAGEVVGLLGINGAGKTTVMRMLVGLVRPTGGEVEVLGAATPLPPAVSRRIGAALDAPLFYRWMTGRAMLRSLLHTAGEPDRGQVDAALQRVELLEQADKRIRAYSQGMRQRLALAAALLRDPDLLVLDEPTNGLDPQGIRLIRRLIQEERERGTAILISSHQMDEIQRLCDRIVVIANGTVAASGTVGDLGFGGPGQPQTLEDWFFALHDQEATS